jgi:hypothetical protein
MIYENPKWLKPTTFESRKNENDNFRRILNPDNGSEITGEVGKVGRSGRCSALIVDESQEIEYPEQLDADTESTTNFRLDLGTMHGMNHFYKRLNSGKVLTDSIWWYQDPRKNPEWRTGKVNPDCAWRKYLVATKDAVVIAQEHDGDPNASVEGSFIPAQWVQSAIDFDIPPRDDDEAIGGFDVATGKGRNEAAYIKRVGPVAHWPFVAPFKTSTECAWAVVDRGEEDKILVLNYDEDGLGESLVGTFKNADRPIKFKLNGLHGSGGASDKLIEEEGKTAKEKFRSSGGKRAERWWDVRKRFERTFEHRNKIKFWSADVMISIPNDPILVTQLSQPLMVYSAGGRIGIESKDAMKTRGVESPDRADALIYAFSDYDEYSHVINEFDYTSNANHFKNFEFNRESASAEGYVSIYHGKNGEVSALCTVWCSRTRGEDGSGGGPCLKVYNEIVMANAQPAQIAAKIFELTNPDVMGVKEYIGNETIFDGLLEGKMSPWHLYVREGIMIVKNYTNQEDGAIMIVNNMFQKNYIQIHNPKCKRTMSQLMNWQHKKGQPDQNYGLAIALCQLVTRLRVKRQFVIGEDKPGYFNGNSR